MKINLTLIFTFSFVFVLFFSAIDGSVNKEKIENKIVIQNQLINDSLALVDFYTLTNGLNWSPSWELSAPMSTWYGLCFDNTNCTGGDNIIRIDLEGSNWPPSIPGAICCTIAPKEGCGGNPGVGLNAVFPDNYFFCLTELELLALGGNELLTGTIPDFQGLENLKQLGLQCCGFDSIVNLSNLPSLEELFFYRNNISCQIPAFDNLLNLQTLNGHKNQLYGSVPEFQGLTELKEIYLFENDLSGVVPSFEWLTNLQALWLYKNNFTFEDFLPNYHQLQTIPFLSIHGQEKIYKDTSIELTVGLPFTLDLFVDDTITSNIYTWHKYGDTTFIYVDSINEITFPMISVADTGTYYCVITNNIIPEDSLTLITHDISITTCDPGILIVDESLCPGEERILNGVLYNEINTTGTEIIQTSAFDGCDSIINVNLNYVETEIIEEEITVCEPFVSLSAQNPNNGEGEWSSTGVSLIDNPIDVTTDVSNLEPGVTTFTYTVFNSNQDICNSDDVIVDYQILPSAEDDLYPVNIDGILSESFIENDKYDELNDTIVIISEPSTGSLSETDFIEGQLTFEPSNTSLNPVTIQYELCNKNCFPENCDGAVIRIEIESIDFPNVVTANGDGYNDTFIINFLENNASLFPDNELIIYNQFENIVYKSSPYQNDWGGDCNQKCKGSGLLPAATYHYIFRFGNNEQPVIGRILLLYSGE